MTGQADEAADRPVSRPRRDEVRRRLLDAALQVFAERGFAQASLDQVAAAAGLTKGAVYSNFPSKDALFLALMDQQVATRLALVEDLAEHGPTDAAELGRLLTRNALHERAWQLLFLDYWARAVRDEQVRRGFLAHRQRLREQLAVAADRLLAAAGREALVSSADLATLVLALSNGLAVESLAGTEPVSEELFGSVLAALTRPSGGTT